MSGVLFGSYLSGKVADRFSRTTTVGYGYLIMLGAVMLNVAYNAMFPPVVPWAILPIMLYTIGMSLAMPSITLLSLDLFPARRGMAASMQGFIQTMVMTFASGVVSPLLAESGLKMALGVFVFMAAGYLCWFAYRSHAGTNTAKGQP